MWGMTTYNPPHSPTDQAKLSAMVEAIIAGAELPPIVYVGETALTGSHRIAAYMRAERDERIERDLRIPAVEASDIDLKRALVACGVKWMDMAEHNVLCHALMSVTDSGDVRAALADQTHGDHASRAEIERVRSMTDDEVAAEWETL